MLKKLRIFFFPKKDCTYKVKDKLPEWKKIFAMPKTKKRLIKTLEKLMKINAM